MIEQFRKIYEMLDGFERRRGFLLLLLIIVLGLFEVAGVASIMPFIAVVANPEVIEASVYLKSIHDSMGFTDYNSFLVFLGIAVFIILVSSLLFSAFTYWMLFRFIQMCNYRLSSRLLEAYLHRPYSWFLGRHSADLGKTILSEVNQLVYNAMMPALNVISRATVSVFLMILIILVDPVVAFVTASVFGGIYAVIFLSVRRHLLWIGTDMFEANTGRFKVAQEGLGGIKDVKVSGLEAAYVARYREPAQRFASRQASYMIISELPKYFLEAVAFGGMLAILVILLLRRPGGLGEVLPLIALYAFTGYRLLPAMQQVYLSISSLRFGTHVLNKLHEELTAIKQSYPSAESEARESLLLCRELVLNDVSFSYPGGQRKALDGIHLAIAANTSVGFVGATGAGKTTVIDLILGLLMPDSGHLKVDDTLITDQNLRKWQRSVGYVPQHIFLVDDTVAANIAFGYDPKEIDMEAVERAAKIARLHDFVVNQLNDGYQTMVGERGVRLSGGQRQRIGIARALYHNPSVLVLDEATSALDNVTERAVMDAVHSLGRKKTIIMIAHRLSTVRSCDVIFVMHDGRVSAAGTYDEMIETSPIFRQMAESVD